ncbi:MAG: hypothetical protein MUP76_04480 [Acidimicrobiia bacterium]|nr:hypothetical protein [Acidimicrobiia bacterium]
MTGLLVVSGSGAALAAQESGTADAADIGAVQERVLDRIGDQIDRLGRVLDDLEGEEGTAAEQRAASAAEGIAIFEAAAADVANATTVGEVKDAIRDAGREYRAHRRIRLFYAHVQGDIDKFSRRLDWLDGAIARAEQAGVDVSAAVRESEAAAAGLGAAQDLLDAIDPSMTGDEVVAALKEAHRTAHNGQRHVRAGWKALLEALPPG